MFRKGDSLDVAPPKNGETLDGNGAVPLLLPAGSLGSTGVGGTWRVRTGDTHVIEDTLDTLMFGEAACCCPVSFVHCIPSLAVRQAQLHHYHHQPRRPRRPRQRGHIGRIRSNWLVTVAHDNPRSTWLTDKVRQDALAARLPVGVAVRGRIVCC